MNDRLGFVIKEIATPASKCFINIINIMGRFAMTGKLGLAMTGKEERYIFFVVL